MKQPGLSRIFAAAIVVFAVIGGAMILSGPSVASSSFEPPLKWETLQDLQSEETTAETILKNAEPPALGSFRPSPPVATARELTQRIDGLENRVSALEKALPVSYSPPSPTPSAVVVDSNKRTVCENGVCRVVAHQPRVVGPAKPLPRLRVFRR